MNKNTNHSIPQPNQAGKKNLSQASKYSFSARENARNRIVSNASKKPTSRRG